MHGRWRKDRKGEQKFTVPTCPFSKAAFYSAEYRGSPCTLEFYAASQMTITEEEREELEDVIRSARSAPPNATNPEIPTDDANFELLSEEEIGEMQDMELRRYAIQLTRKYTAEVVEGPTRKRRKKSEDPLYEVYALVDEDDPLHNVYFGKGTDYGGGRTRKGRHEERERKTSRLSGVPTELLSRKYIHIAGRLTEEQAHEGEHTLYQAQDPRNLANDYAPTQYRPYVQLEDGGWGVATSKLMQALWCPLYFDALRREGIIGEEGEEVQADE